MNKLTLAVLAERLSICRLSPDAALPSILLALPFWSATRTPDELSLVVPEEKVLKDWKCEPGWRALKVQGPLDFSLTGILAGISAALAEAGISIFAISTFDTDYILVRVADLDKAIQVLSGKGYEVKVS
jgi:hypothetical protein